MTLNSIVANFQTFKLVDLLDILIIAFLIYQLLGIVNRTRAGQLAKGALIVLAVYLVANILNMRTVTWLLNSLLQVGLLTLVVLLVPAGSIAEELRTTALAVSLVTLAMGNVAFLLYDRALHNMLMLYHLVWQPKLHKMLGVH